MVGYMEYNISAMSLMRVLLNIVSGALVFVAVLFGGALQSFAQTAATPQGGIVLATINVQDIKILSQKGNVFDISFNITNRNGVQFGVKYGVQLISSTKAGQTVVDEYVYPEALNIAENSSVSKEITYTAPSNLSGTYMLLISSKNDSGFPFALMPAGNVTLTAGVKSLVISPESCFLQVSGEKGSSHYNLVQGVDVAQNENLVLTCTATNGMATKLSVTPSFETRYRTAYGNVVSQTGGDLSPISFAAGEKKTFSIALPKAAEPQAYNVFTTLKADGIVSNTIDAHYVISGSSATVQTLSLNKNVYRKGETASALFIWSPSADSFPNSRIGTASPSAVSTNIVMTDGSGNACANPVNEQLTNAARLVVSFPIIQDCTNPRIALSLTDAAGKVLAQKELIIVSPSMAQTSSPGSSSSSGLVAIVVVLILLGGVAYLVKRKDDMKQPPLS